MAGREWGRRYAWWRWVVNNPLTQASIPEPWDPDVRIGQAGGDQQGVVGALLKPYLDVIVRQGHLGRGIHEIAEQVARRGCLVAVTDPGGQQPGQAAGHSVR